jgi:hypothetical protein
LILLHLMLLFLPVSYKFTPYIVLTVQISPASPKFL